MAVKENPPYAGFMEIDRTSTAFPRFESYRYNQTTSSLGGAQRRLEGRPQARSRERPSFADARKGALLRMRFRGVLSHSLSIRLVYGMIY